MPRRERRQAGQRAPRALRPLTWPVVHRSSAEARQVRRPTLQPVRQLLGPNLRDWTTRQRDLPVQAARLPRGLTVEWESPPHHVPMPSCGG